jgi:3-hydroxyisobutyrate dehydrogenase-like beta-hydroxyacid dehydrogenase
MNQIDNIMALARECEFVAGDSEAYDRCRQTLRAAIEQAINTCGPGAGCLHKVARIEALQQELATIKESLTVQEPVARLLDELDLRDYFAAKAMQANRARNSSYASWDDLAKDAYELADAMLKERNK